MSHEKGAPDAGFCTTHWSAVVAAGRDGDAQADAALAELCRAYWYPLYAYVRRRGKNQAEAEDLTQGFFAQVLEKNYFGDVTPGVGRFRAFLLTSFKNYLTNEWHRVQTAKRGGGRVIFSLDQFEPEARYQFEPVENVTPESLFEKRWALTVLEHVLLRLRQEFVRTQKSDLFDELKVFLSAGVAPCSYAEVATRTGVTESNLKVMIHRLRRRYGELLRSEIAGTVKHTGEIEDEIRYLISVVAS